MTIAPLLSGGGMRIKVLDAMALGRPVVATTLGAGGVEVDPQRDIVIADDVDSFAREVVALLGDAARRKSLGEAARAGVASRYDGEAIARGLLQFYATL